MYPNQHTMPFSKTERNALFWLVYRKISPSFLCMASRIQIEKSENILHLNISGMQYFSPKNDARYTLSLETCISQPVLGLFSSPFRHLTEIQVMSRNKCPQFFVYHQIDTTKLMLPLLQERLHKESALYLLLQLKWKHSSDIHHKFQTQLYTFVIMHMLQIVACAIEKKKYDILGRLEHINQLDIPHAMVSAHPQCFKNSYSNKLVMILCLMQIAQHSDSFNLHKTTV